MLKSRNATLRQETLRSCNAKFMITGSVYDKRSGCPIVHPQVECQMRWQKCWKDLIRARKNQLVKQLMKVDRHQGLLQRGKIQEETSYIKRFEDKNSTSSECYPKRYFFKSCLFYPK